MVDGSFVLSVHLPRTAQQKRRIQFRRTYLRYCVVLLAIMIVLVYQYCFDNPSALQQHIQDHYQHKQHEPLGQATFNLLYAFYSFPNIIIPFIGGTLIDRLGPRVMIIICALLCLAGQMVFTYGGFRNVFVIMLIGRTVFGLGGQVLQASQGTLISNWFKANQLPLILGICLSFPKLGSALNNYLTPIIAHKYVSEDLDDASDLGIPMLFSTFLMAFGVICSIIVFYIDKDNQKQEKYFHESALLIGGQSGAQKSSISQLTGKNTIRSQNYISVTAQQQPQSQVVQNEHIKLSDIMKLPASYWLLIIVATLAQGLFIPFLDNGNKYYVVVFQGIDDPQNAGIYLTIPYILGAILVPLFGYLVSKTDKRSILIIASSFLFVLTFFSMLLAETNHTFRSQAWFRWIPVSLLGISVATYCTVIIPTLPTIVSPKLLGTAFGLMQVLQNVAMAFFPIITGVLRQTSQDNQLLAFHKQTLFFFLVGCVLLAFSIILKAVDYATGSKIDTTDFKRKYIMQVMKEDPNDD